jgi:hypothetical protein
VKGHFSSERRYTIRQLFFEPRIRAISKESMYSEEFLPYDGEISKSYVP